MKLARDQAGDILEQLSRVIDLIDPTVKMNKKVAKSKASLLQDLTGKASASRNYAGCIEQVCDDLLENADR